MAASIPAALKSADIARFAQRAGQVEKAKPVIAYWCNYWIVNQILSKGLHNTDDESMTYTMNLMDKLEQTKKDHADNDAVMDDLAGQAYVEEFGLEILQRSVNAMTADKASRQTADTFQAAATFLDTCQIWGPLDPEVASKIKFAKYHALRIARAIKAGEDPNLSNPAPEPPPSLEQQPLDPEDPDVQILNESRFPAQSQNHAFQPFIEEVPDEHHRLQRHLAQRSSLDQSLHPSRAPSNHRQPDHGYPDRHGAPSPQTVEDFYSNAPTGEVSPLASPGAEHRNVDDVEYFPRVPQVDGITNIPTLPEAPPEDPGSPPAYVLPDSTAIPPPAFFSAAGQRPSQVPHRDSLQSFPPPQMDQSAEPMNPQTAPPQYRPQQPPQPFKAPSSSTQPPPFPPPQQGSSVMRGNPPRGPVSQPISSQLNYVADEEAIMKAQKHARWAISALNFEDVKTAVKELRGALESLGA